MTGVDMNFFGSLFLFIALLLFFYALNRRRKDSIQVNEEKPAMSPGAEKIMHEELSRRRRILEKVETFLKGSQFIEPIAVWHKEKIYKYVYNGRYLYEFDEFMAENNQRIGIDEDYLCFKQLCYKRVMNPVDFINKFSHIITH
jgi:hypothetical protein